MSAILLVTSAAASAQMGPSGPPAVDVIAVTMRSVAHQEQIIGRVQAMHRVDIVARVAGFMEEKLFTEGVEVKAGQLLYRLERGTYEAAVESARAAIDQATAQLENASLALARSEKLLQGPAGLQSSFIKRAPISLRRQDSYVRPRRSYGRPPSISTTPKSDPRSTVESAAPQ